MSTTEVIVTPPTDPHRPTSPLSEAIEAVTHQGAHAIRSSNQPREWKLVALRECPTPEQLQDCATPQQAADYWRLQVQTNPYFNPDCEFFAVLILNTRRRIKGHVIVGMGILDSVLVHPRDLIRAGQLLKIEVLDHLIIGQPAPERAKHYCWLKELGTFYS